MWQAVCATDEVEDGGVKIVTVANKEIGVFRVGDEWRAVLNYCPHWGAPICQGRVTGRVLADANGALCHDAENRVLRCPWHHWEFDLTTGEPLLPIPQRLRVFPVREEQGQVWVEV